MTKLADYLSTQKIDPRRILTASKQVEAMSREDRAIQYAKVLVKKAGKNAKLADSIKETATKKGTSGNPVSGPLLTRALEGKMIPPAAKTRILRAVSRILEQKKKPAVQLKDLF